MRMAGIAAAAPSRNRGVLVRSALESRLDEAFGRRLTLLVAADEPARRVWRG